MRDGRSVMNILEPDKVRKLYACFEEGLGVRATARKTGVNRETVSKYFKMICTFHVDDDQPATPA